MKVRVGNHVVKTGCWVAGHHGQYAIDCAATIADTLLGTNYTRKVSLARQADDWDALVDLTDEVENILNSHTEDRFMWSWWEGEFFLFTLDEADEVA